MLRSIVVLSALFLQASWGVFFQWQGVMIHFFPAVFYSIIPAVPLYPAIILALVSGLVYDGLWGAYPGVYIGAYVLGTMTMRGLAYNLNIQQLSARIVVSLTGLLVYAGVTGGLLYVLKQSLAVLRHIGWELVVQITGVCIVMMLLWVINKK